MNLNFLIKKKHIFKRRKKNFFTGISLIHRYGGIYTKNQIKFEFVYLRVFKKIFRKKYFKKNNLLKIVKFWIMVRPNFLLTMKSKNSRMGSGVGAYIRVCSIIKPNRPIMFIKNYSSFFITNTLRYLKLKLNLNLYANLLNL